MSEFIELQTMYFDTSSFLQSRQRVAGEVCPKRSIEQSQISISEIEMEKIKKIMTRVNFASVNTELGNQTSSFSQLFLKGIVKKYCGL